MSISDIIEYLIIGIICGAFSTFFPVMLGHVYNAILSMMRNA